MIKAQFRAGTAEKVRPVEDDTGKLRAMLPPLPKWCRIYCRPGQVDAAGRVTFIVEFRV